MFPISTYRFWKQSSYKVKAIKTNNRKSFFLGGGWRTFDLPQIVDIVYIWRSSSVLFFFILASRMSTISIESQHSIHQIFFSAKWRYKLNESSWLQCLLRLKTHSRIEFVYLRHEQICWENGQFVVSHQKIPISCCHGCPALILQLWPFSKLIRRLCGRGICFQRANLISKARSC